MKAKWFSFILLALCLVLALTGCDGGSGGGGNDSSITYIISDINPKDDISSPIESVSGGIKFTATESFIDVETIINDTITLKKDNTFSSTLKITEDGLVAFNTTFTGTWSGNDTSMTLTVKEAKEKQ